MSLNKSRVVQYRFIMFIQLIYSKMDFVPPKTFIVDIHNRYKLFHFRFLFERANLKAS